MTSENKPCVWSGKLGLVYYPIPKNACTSIKTVLASALKIPMPESGSIHELIPTGENVWLEDHTVVSKWGPPEPQLPYLQSFAVVRHPLERLVSCYADKVLNKRSGLPWYFRTCNSFNTFLNVVKVNIWADEHFAPQHTMIPEQIDSLICFDDLTNNWDHFRDSLGMRLGPLDKLNSSQHDDWESYYTKPVREVMEHFYKDDIALYERSKT